MARKRNKLLIVDGYNVLRSGQRYVHMRRQDDYTVEKYNNVREALISDVAAFAGSEYRAIIVFDGADNPESAGKTQRVGGIKIMFSPFGSSADKVIEKLAHDAREQHVEVMVVTSDASIQDAVFGGGVDRMSANGFSLEMDDLSE
ncbi:MAG: NYN domain-containing protein, partial [Eggerthellaceae bacterium]